MVVIPLKMYAGIDVFILLSIPGFIIAGNLMNQGGLTDKIINFCNHLLGHVRGGLSYVNIIASMLFAGISGTAISDTASLGAVMIPAMKKEGYDSDDVERVFLPPMLSVNVITVMSFFAASAVRLSF